jgi:hypothetical protein
VFRFATLADRLITLQNAALTVVDYQQNQFRSVRSMDSDLTRCS